MKRIILAALCLFLLPAMAAPGEAAWNGAVTGFAAELAEGAVLRRAVYWSGGDYQTENYIELAPGGALRPAAVSGDVLCAKAALTDMAASLEGGGTRVAAGINGGFYHMATLVPVGLVVRDGALRSDDEGLNAVGFRADGSAVIGKPRLWLTLTAGGETLEGLTLNHARGAGPALFTPDFAAATQAAGDGWNLILAPEREEDTRLPLTGNVALTLEAVIPAKGALAIPEGRLVLSLAGDTEAEKPGWLAALQSGDALTLRIASNAAWHDVESAVGLLYPLLENGAVAEGLEDYAAAAPRSAVGVRADGGLVFYTLDGRQSGHSVGAGLADVALRMKELGCVNAGALDGGASTNLSAALPGDRALSQINSPSDGEPREVANYIFLVTDAQPAHRASRLALYPLNIDALAGAEIPLAVRAVDENGWPAEAPENVSFAVSGDFGDVKEGVFRAVKAGEGTVSVSAPGLKGASIPVRVTESPDTIELYGEVYGRLTQSLTLAPGQEVDLTARAARNHVLLRSADENFTWALEEAAGTVDETGHLIPAPASGGGLLTVSAGEAAVRIPITVWSGVPFRDVAVTDGYFDAVKYVYDHRLFNGTSDTEFAPEAVMNRGMLLTVLWRMNGEPEAETQPAFADVGPEDWYGPAVAWGVERGLVNGYGETAFGPLDHLTKEQILTILWRYAGQPEPQSAAPPAPDAGDVSGYALEPVRWATAPGRELFAAEDGLLLPGASMSRAAVAETLMRYLTVYEI